MISAHALKQFHSSGVKNKVDYRAWGVCIAGRHTPTRSTLKMSAWLLVVVLFLLLFIVLVIGLFIHAGYFSDLRIRTSFPASLPRRAAYTVHRGSYKNVHVPLSRIASFAPHQRNFCLFYDDPKKV